MNTITLHIGDVRDIQAGLDDASVDLIVTSPPFLALRSYLPPDHPDKHREIGSEATPAEYLDTLLELTDEWRRLLTPTGSLCVEIGDTYSGTNPKAALDAETWRGDGGTDGGLGAGRCNLKTGGKDWPLPKSLCGIPTLYTWSLAYGHNLLNPGHRIRPWRVRNLLTWTRPNPPVGALGDKFRPATSFVTVACDSDKRWFDLDAVRGGISDDMGGGGYQNGIGTLGGRNMRNSPNNPAGAPPLDWWDDNQEEPTLIPMTSSSCSSPEPTTTNSSTPSTTTAPPTSIAHTTSTTSSTPPANSSTDPTDIDNPPNDNQPDWRVVYGPDGRSYVTVACTSDKRWFDLDAVRTEHKQPDDDRSTRASVKTPDRDGRLGAILSNGGNPAGAPPLDWQDDNQPDWRIVYGPDGRSYVTVACTSDKRWFDLDAVRVPYAEGTLRQYKADPDNPVDSQRPTIMGDNPSSKGMAMQQLTHAGAPPLDWQDDNNPDWQPLHNLPTHPYKGAHYATFNPALPRRLIEAMCPLAVCVVCGEPRRRVVGDAEYVTDNGHKHGGDTEWRHGRGGEIAGMGSTAPTSLTRRAPTLGWTDCGCTFDMVGRRTEPRLQGDPEGRGDTQTLGADREKPDASTDRPTMSNYRPGIVYDPFGGSGTTAIAAATVGRDSVLIDLDARNIDLIRQRITENFRIVNEVHDGDTYTWTVAPASRHELANIAAGQGELDLTA